MAQLWLSLGPAGVQGCPGEPKSGVVLAPAAFAKVLEFCSLIFLLS